ATGKTLAQLNGDLEASIGRFCTRRIDLPLSAQAREALARRRTSAPERLAGQRVASVNRIDGLKLILEDGSWILVRESGTEPVARVYVEASSPERVDALASAAQELLKA